jgi:putative hemolysin
MSANPQNIFTKIADRAQEFDAIAQLRYEVFVRELGGGGAGVNHALRTESDAFDEHAQHLIAMDRDAGDAVVGVYRVMTAEMAAKAGRFYSEDEFDLTALRTSGRKILELGRSCVHPNYRDGVTMFHLWQRLAEYVLSDDFEILFGVASFHGTDPMKYAHALSNLAASYAAPDHLRTKSKKYQTMALVGKFHIDRNTAIRETPSLIKSYLRLGGVVGDGAFIDDVFNTVDVCLIMDTVTMSQRHREIYSKAATL